MIIFIQGVVHGIIICTIITFSFMSYYENKLIDEIILSHTTPQMKPEERILKILMEARDLLNQRHDFLNEFQDFRLFESPTFRPTNDILISPKGSCGVYSVFLARILQRGGFDVRVAQLLCSENSIVQTCHVVIEVKTNDRWIVLDPLFGLYFRKPDGNLDDIRGVAENWPYYTRLLPPKYPQNVSYELVRYSNWREYMFVKSFLELLLGAGFLDHFSVRAYLLNVNQTKAIIVGVIYIALLCGSAAVICRNSRSQIK